LNPSVNVHSAIPPSELLRSKNRSEQIADQNQTDDHSKKVSHSSKPFTTAGIQNAQPKKNDRNQNIDKIRHDELLVSEVGSADLRVKEKVQPFPSTLSTDTVPP
jgi:hypothetical protein